MASTGIEDDVPRIFFLSQNFPNPFINNTIIKYGLPKKVEVRLCVYNSVGQLVGILEDGEKEAGYYTVRWSGREENLPSGIYFIRLSAGEFTSTRKCILIK